MLKLLTALLVSSSVVWADPPVLVLDKENASLTVYYPDTQTRITQPALLGRIKSDKLDMTNYDHEERANGITPSGTFTVNNEFSWQLNEPMLVFIQGAYAVDAIHPLWTRNPDQHRVQRLYSPTPADNRVTGGCVNVDPDFFYNVLVNLPNGTKFTILPEAEKLPQGIVEVGPLISVDP